MAAEDNLGRQFTLYHGTKAELKEGDVILPGSKVGRESNWPWLGTRDKAFATEHLEAAKYFASASQDPNTRKIFKQISERYENDLPTDDITRPREVNRVYEVEPLGPTKIANLSKSRAKHAEAIVEHTNTEGFRVKKQVWKQEPEKDKAFPPMYRRPKGLN